MKKLKCDVCEFEGQGETFDDWFAVMRAHWGDRHADVMRAMASSPNAKGEQKKWMADAQAKFNVI